MRRFFLALGLLVSLAYSADAATIRGAADLNAAIQAETLVDKIACTHNEFYCNAGTQRVCRHGRCWCAPCGGPRPYYGPRYAPPPYYAPRPRRYYSPDCGPGWSWQDGQCKPYRGY